MTKSVRVVFKYSCQRCGYSWETEVFLPDDQRITFIVCGTCKSLVRPHTKVNPIHLTSCYKIFIKYRKMKSIHTNYKFVFSSADCLNWPRKTSTQRNGNDDTNKNFFNLVLCNNIYCIYQRNFSNDQTWLN